MMSTRALLAATLVAVLTAGPVSAQTYTFSTLATFNSTNGAQPVAGLVIDGDGNLFGTTRAGGSLDSGTVFQVVAGSGTITTLATFGGASGSNPYGGVVMDGAGNLFGTARSGGANNVGTVFQVAAGTSTLSTLATFNTTNGANPQAGLIIDADGNLFGTTYNGGANGVGTVFEVVAGSGTVTTLATLGGTNGTNPYAGLVMDADGNLFGTTYNGGASNKGTVFKVEAGTGTLTTLATFNDTNGANPQGGLVIDADGNLFGTTQGGGAGEVGTVFQVATGTGTLTTLATFNGTNGSSPASGLILDGSGNLFGTTFTGGTNGVGTVFQVAAGSGTVTTLHAFNTTDGSFPIGGLAMDGAGNLFGTTYGGGTNDMGIVFQLTPTPEPATVGLIATAGLGLVGWVRRKRTATSC